MKRRHHSPSRSDISWLRIQRIIPRPHAKLQPALGIKRQVNLPQSPSIVILGRHILRRHFIPDRASVWAYLHANRPVSAARIRPALQLNLAVVRDDVHVLGRDDGRRHRHVLDREAVAVQRVLFADLRGVVEVLLPLDGRLAGVPDAADLVQPLAASGADVAEDDRPKGKAVEFGKRLAVHLPGQQDLVDLDLAPGNGDDVVVHLALLEVGVGAEKLDVHRAVLQTAAVLDHLLERDAGPAGGSDSAFRPGSVDELIAIARILVDLFEAASAGTLKTDDVALAGEKLFVLQVG